MSKKKETTNTFNENIKKLDSIINDMKNIKLPKLPRVKNNLFPKQQPICITTIPDVPEKDPQLKKKYNLLEEFIRKEKFKLINNIGIDHVYFDLLIKKPKKISLIDLKTYLESKKLEIGYCIQRPYNFSIFKKNTVLLGIYKNSPLFDKITLDPINCLKTYIMPKKTIDDEKETDDDNNYDLPVDELFPDDDLKL